MKVMKHIAYPASILELLQMRITASLYKAARKRLFHVVTSEYLVRKIRSISGKVLIPPAVDTELFKPSGINERKSSKILYIGPLTPSRFPYFTVLRALKKLNTDYGKDVELNVGVAPWRLSREKVYLKEMTNYAAKLGLREKLKILVRGFMPKEKVDLYNCSDVIIQFYLEPLDFIPVDPPITVLEAMSCEKPVVVTKSLSLPNFINSGYNGFLLARVREKELAEALSEALDRKHCIGSNARNTIVKKFSIERVSSSLKKLYDNLI
jgi:glycosyltransferase involved in cell wall biosynthesis